MATDKEQPKDFSYAEQLGEFRRAMHKRMAENMRDKKDGWETVNSTLLLRKFTTAIEKAQMTGTQTDWADVGCYAMMFYAMDHDRRQAVTLAAKMVVFAVPKQTVLDMVRLIKSGGVQLNMAKLPIAGEGIQETANNVTVFFEALETSLATMAEVVEPGVSTPPTPFLVMSESPDSTIVEDPTPIPGPTLSQSRNRQTGRNQQK